MGPNRMLFRHRSGIRFTIRGLMIAVAAVAGVLGLLRTWPVLVMLLIVLVLLNLMPALIGLCVMWAQPPGWRLHWRPGVAVGLQGAGILAAGWVWSLWASGFPGGPAGSVGGGSLAWGWTIPMATTGCGLAAFILRLVVACWKSRRGLVPLVVFYAWAMMVAWFITFFTLRTDLY